ncbi:hypothetical protein IMSAG049_01351 [Clostridiales bacterium]|nr:hypothetical protein IMSAG049_01351 [Clostridiales bacterium]
MPINFLGDDMDNFRKIYVEVNVTFSADGKITPNSLKWGDGRVYDIDRIIDVRRAASLKAGGQGMRYTCRIRGKERYLFYDEYGWFVECAEK